MNPEDELETTYLELCEAKVQIACLEEKVKHLQRSLAICFQEKNDQFESLWGVVEDVSIGTKLECHKCGKPRPCLCLDV